MYKQTGEEALFYELKPTITQRQRGLLNCFYKARREYSQDFKIKERDLIEFSRNCDYEEDVAVFIMKQLDDLYLKLVFDKLKKAGKHGR